MLNNILIFSCLLIVIYLFFTFNNKDNQQTIFPKINVKKSAPLGYTIHIDGNWTETNTTYDWCTGAGTHSDPYVIQDIEVDGLGVSTCILINNSNIFFRIENCTFLNSGPLGVNQAGIKLINTTNGKLINNNCSNNKDYGIYLDFDCFNNSIIANNVSDNTFYGIYLYNNCDNNTITSNKVSNHPEGIRIISSSDNNTISRNNASSNTQGIVLSGTCKNNTISGNLINGNSNWGVLLNSNCVNNTFFNNTINGNTQIGVRIFSADCEDNIFYNNSFNGNGDNARDDWTNNYWDNGSLGNYWDDYGNDGGFDDDDDGYGDIPYNISVGGGKDNYPIWDDGFSGSTIHIDDNSVNNWAWAKTRTWCSGSGTFTNPYIIKDLVINGLNSSSCITINNSKNVYFKIENCTTFNSSIGLHDAGILLEFTNKGTLINNNCSINRNFGIHLYRNCDNNTIFRNIVNNNIEDGIRIQILCDNNRILGNNISNNDNGILLGDCEYSVISGNNVSNNKNGIVLEPRCNYNNITSNIIKNNIGIIGFGIYLDYNCDNNTISGNNVSDNEGGIYLINTCVNNTFLNNTLNDNTIFGINISSSDCNDNLIYNNTFNNNGVNAWDNGVTNKWDNGSIGNYWSNYGTLGGYDIDDNGIGDIAYNISGSGNSNDSFPIWDDGVEIPYFINFQDNFSMVEGDILKNIIWTPVSRYIISDSFWVLRNGTNFFNGSWDGSQIVFSELYKLAIGSYNFTCFVNNTNGNQNCSIVIVTIVLNHFPQITNTTNNKTVDLDQIDYTLTWLAIDMDGNNHTYWVIRNQTIVVEGLWNNDTTIMYLETELLSAGLYNYTCFINDTTGALNQSSIYIIVNNYESTLPVIIFEFTKFYLNTTTPEYFNLGLTVNCTVIDMSSIQFVFIYENCSGALFGIMNPIGNGIYAYTLNISALSWGDTFYFYIAAIDVFSNVGFGLNGSSFYTAKIYDFQPPSTQISFTPYQGTNNVNKSTLISLSASDGSGSGTSIIMYRLNNGEWLLYSSPFNLSSFDFGEITISYYAIDSAGNSEGVKSITLNLIGVGILLGPVEIIILITTLAGIIGLLSIIILKTRKKKTEKEPEKKREQAAEHLPPKQESPIFPEKTKMDFVKEEPPEVLGIEMPIKPIKVIDEEFTKEKIEMETSEALELFMPKIDEYKEITIPSKKIKAPKYGVMCSWCDAVSYLTKEEMEYIKCNSCENPNFTVLYFCHTCDKNYSINKEDFLLIPENETQKCPVCGKDLVLIRLEE